MKQVIQSFKTGQLAVVDVPPPQLRARGIMVQTAASAVSVGTERMVVDFAAKSALGKARARPDLARQVMEKARRDGVIPTIEAVRGRLEQPLPLGYSSAGTIVAVGSETGMFQVGDRVACAGGGYACHAEMAYVPRTLAVRLPDGVSFHAAAFSALGAIALQGVRQGEVVLGQKVMIIGLGLIGQLAAQIATAAGCEVFAVDLIDERVQLALALGASAGSLPDRADVEGHAFTGGRGFDTVLVTADTESDQPIALAGAVARDRGIVVAVGAVGLSLPRRVYYEKELDLRLSRSYGPGRYDSAYEEMGQDYPYGYVRWTEQRNMEAFVRLLATGAVKVEPLITHRFPIERAADAYDLISGPSGEPSLGIALTYDSDPAVAARTILNGNRRDSRDRPGPVSNQPIAAQPAVRLGMVGAGSFVNATLLPAMSRLGGLELVGIVSASGLTARLTAERFGFGYCASKPADLMADERINWLAIATRHNLHAVQAIAGMRSGKDVFVEKPLAINRAELVETIRAGQQTGRRLLVGFNRRFASFAQEMREFLASRNRPLIATYRVNAGSIPGDHWTHDPAIGGGRIVSEACHFIDILQWVTGAPPVDVTARALPSVNGAAEDEVVITLTFADSSLGTVIYTSGGDRAFSKERVEVFGGGRVAVLDDFRTLELVLDGRRIRRRERLRPDKGHRRLWQALVEAAMNGAPNPIAIDEIVATHLATYAALESLRTGQPVAVDLPAFWREVDEP